MKKTLLAAIIAASFGVSAYAVTLPVTNGSGNPISVVLSGSLDLAGQGDLVVSTTDDQNSKTSNTMGYSVNGASFAVGVNSPFMGQYSAFSQVKFGFKTEDNGFGPLELKKAVIGVNNDAFGTLTIGKQKTASDAFAYNGFGDFDIADMPSNSTGKGGLGIMYTSPEFSGVSFGVSLSAPTFTSNSKKVDGKDQDGTTQFDLNDFSVGVQYADDALTVAGTVDVQALKNQSTAIATTLGAGYAINDVTVFGNLGFVTNAFADGKDTNQFAVQAGASFAATDADTLAAAAQFRWDSTKDVKDHNYIVGLKGAAYHTFNDNFSAYAFAAFNYTGTKLEKGDSKASDVEVKYGAGLKYEF